MKTVISVQPLSDYRLLVEFKSGEKRISDIFPLLSRPIFSFLRDTVYFDKVYLEYGAVTWKDCNGNEVDICPDDLYMNSSEYTK